MSIFASPYTDAFCLQADPPHPRRRCRAPTRTATTSQARTDMANAATIAGLAFSNAFVGVNHALAHAVGARFGIAHGRANAHLPAARAALQRRAADEVHAGARLLAPTSRRRSTRRSLGPRPRRPRRGERARAAVRPRRRAARRPSACRAPSPTLGIDPEDVPRGDRTSWPRRPSATRACARTRACRSSSSCASCSPRWPGPCDAGRPPTLRA